MKVILDISSVGDNPATRTGVARVAWTLSHLLHQKLGSNLSFSATGSIEASLQVERLLNRHPELQSAVNPVSSTAQYINQLNTQITKHQTTSANNLLKQAKKQALLNLSRLFNITRQPIIPKKLKEADIFHSTYPRISKQVRKALPNRHLQTVYDLTPLILDKEYFALGHVGVTKRLIDTIQPHDWITTISDATRNDLLNRRSLDPKRVITVPLAASPELFYPVSDALTIQAVKQKYQLPEENYFLSLHSLVPHKNMEHLIDCFKQVILQEKEKNLHLVICGSNQDSAASMIRKSQLTATDLEFIHFTGFVDDVDLAAIYSGALGFIFPSLYEGFGLPVLEAMQCGCPVITSNNSSLPEVVGEAGFLVSPTDKDALCESIVKLARNPDLRSKYSRFSIDRSTLFSWEKTVEKTLDIYRRIII